MSSGYVLVNVEPGSESDVYKVALLLDCVTDANLLFGDYDLIVKIEASSMGEIARHVVESIRAIPGVVNTKTLACAEM
ncbi:MAG: AsnC family transcriptional regulator [Euryarchaeota archaeon]|nr:AsnC family transcriptional regulator [Euryarchaeota archaeon]|tara:strand:- start:161 stop:394 length:234 start_codon:yes stop_codon:yes gene_type:complete